MMASMTQPFGQPGMVGPAAVAPGGQPMAHGHPSNQGMPGAQHLGVAMGQQMPHGMPGPGGLHVSQPGQMVTGMMPGGGPPGVAGAGPNAHAMSHLNPHTAMLTAQQMQQASKFFVLCHSPYELSPDE